MLFEIEVWSELCGKWLTLDRGVGLFEACDRMGIYRRKRNGGAFRVVNMETGEIEWEVDA